MRSRAALVLVPLAALLLSGAYAPRPPASAFGPGERLVLDVSWLGLDVGRADIVIGAAVTRADAAAAFPISVEANTHGLADHLYGIHDRFVTWFDPASGRTWGNHLDANEGGKSHSLDMRFSAPDHVVVTNELAGAREGWEREVSPGAADLASVLYVLRARALDPGEAFSVPVFTGRDQWMLDARVVGHESVEVGAGRFDAVVVKARTHLTGKLASDRELTLWMTADAHHVPLQLEAQFALGAFRAQLVDYASAR